MVLWGSRDLQGTGSVCLPALPPPYWVTSGETLSLSGPVAPRCHGVMTHAKGSRLQEPPFRTLSEQRLTRGPRREGYSFLQVALGASR